MSFGEFLFTLLIKPIQIIFELVYGIAFEMIQNRGLSIIVLSLAINFLVLPLYRVADKMQSEQKEIELSLANGVNHIKKTFKGDERMLLLQTYYRQNGYKPIYILRGAAPLLLQIPFFIAAYKFLSSMSALQGVSFGLISDLGAPDKLLTLFGFQINILPILMTAINLISSFIYSKDYPAKTKIQLYVTALFFLVFLYKSPAGLVFYWTLNNAFSLLKTIVLKLKDSKKALFVLFSIAGFLMMGFGVAFKSEDITLILLITVLLQFPLLLYLASRKRKATKVKAVKEYSPNKKLFFTSCAFVTVLIGLVIPSNVIKASPLEFFVFNEFENPLKFILSSFLLSLGMFIIWFGVFYTFSSNKNKVLFEKIMIIFSACSIINYMIFSRTLGLIKTTLQYEEGLLYKTSLIIINTVLIIVLIALMALLLKKVYKQFVSILLVCTLAFCGVFGVNVFSINKTVSSADLSESYDAKFTIPLSKTNQNVVVIMLDRAMGLYMPYIFNEKPELKDSFNGFTCYSNVISYGRSTIFGLPAMMGGYEYTPTELNARSNELLYEKHNESLKVMPVLFEQNDYNVTVCNPAFAGYKWVPDLSIYDDYENINAYYVNSINRDANGKTIDGVKRNFFVYSVMVCCPVLLQYFIYDSGSYYLDKQIQKVTSAHTAIGVDNSFLNNFSVLSNLSAVTNVTDEDKGNFFLMTNSTTHEPQLLQEPNYSVSNMVDNTEFDLNNQDRFTLNGVTVNIDRARNYSLYQTNMAAMIELSKWFDYLKQNGVYDNTRIVLVSDHGYALHMGGTCDELIMDASAENDYGDASSYFPLLMVKDFNSTGFTFDDSFMTNADVPTIAFDGIINNPVNPFTGKEINNNEKYSHDQYIIASMDLEASGNIDNKTFTPADWYTVHDSIWDKSNWQKVAEDKVLTTKDYN